MSGGDFLMLLLEKAPLPEDDTRFYIAEMINGIDACHNLGFMHRDVKVRGNLFRPTNLQPDNFLVSPTGHLKIADFGLATSGEWIYQEAYRSSRRKDLLRKYHRSVIHDGGEIDDDEDGPELVRREKLNKMHANSIVGTYYYMAPEVLQGEKYNATADW